jgi:N-dimethylarginine dimethylaminohydrolase
MPHQPTLLMVDPAYFDVSYAINPWMQPDAWARDPRGMHQAALRASQELREALEGAGCKVELAAGVPGLPDMVFPANAAVVLDGRALAARFRHPQRRGEEAHFLAIFQRLREQGLLAEVAQLPEGCYQEGAGDCIWDAQRGLFWAGHGPRSRREAIDVMGEFFGQEMVPLELVSDQVYHLDVGFCPLSGGEILYFPPALSGAALRTLHARVPAGLRIEATEDDLRHFSVNAVCVGSRVVMNRTTGRLRDELTRRGYSVIEVDLAPFVLSGGGAFCMTLRLDRSSTACEPMVEGEVTAA